eukprot:6177256-Pleurochrysis_carterae.AAC.7
MRAHRAHFETDGYTHSVPRALTHSREDVSEHAYTPLSPSPCAGSFLATPFLHRPLFFASSRIAKCSAEPGPQLHFRPFPFALSVASHVLLPIHLNAEPKIFHLNETLPTATYKLR